MSLRSLHGEKSKNIYLFSLFFVKKFGCSISSNHCMFLIVNKPLWRNQAIKRNNIEGALRVCKFLSVDCVMVGSLQVLIVENVQYVSVSSELLKKTPSYALKLFSILSFWQLFRPLHDYNILRILSVIS